MPVRQLSCVRTPSLALFYHPSHPMSYNQVEVNGTSSTVNSNTEQGNGAASAPSPRKRINTNVILQHLRIGGAVQCGVSSRNNGNSSLSRRKNSFSAVHTLQPDGDSMSMVPVTCSEKSDLRSFSSRPVRHGNTLLSQHQCNDAAQTDQVHTLQPNGDLTSKLPVTCREQSNPRTDFSSLSVSPSSILSSQYQCNGAAQTDQVSEARSKKDDDIEYTSLSEKYSLPTSFGKKHSPPVAGYRNKNSKWLERRNYAERFDICLSESEAIQAKGLESEYWTFSRSLRDVDNEADYPEENLLIDEPMQRVLRPGMVLLKKYISPSEQVSIVKKCRELGLGPGGFYRPGYKYGAKLRLQMMCLGLDWDPQTRKYQKRRQIDRAKPPDIPREFHQLVKRAMQDSHACIREAFNICNAENILPRMSPDVCIVNFYNETGRLGLHQDRDESAESLFRGLPVVSFSIGDSAEFLYGDQRDVNKAEKLILESGDVLVFGGDSRHVFHGISSIIPDSTPEFLLSEPQLRPGRLNLTFRQHYVNQC